MIFIFSNVSFADSMINYNNQVDKLITLSNDLDTLLGQYSIFLNNYANYNGYINHLFHYYR